MRRNGCSSVSIWSGVVKKCCSSVCCCVWVLQAINPDADLPVAHVGITIYAKLLPDSPAPLPAVRWCQPFRRPLPPPCRPWSPPLFESSRSACSGAQPLSLYLSGTPGTSAAIVRARRHMPLAIADAVGGGAHTTCTKVRQAHASSLMFRAPLPAVAHLQPPDLSLDLWHPDDFHHRKSPAARFVVIAGDADVRVHQRLTNGCAQSAPAVRRCPR